MKTVRLTTAQAIVRFLTVQRTLIDGEERPLCAGVFAIFGHGNVTCLGEALHDARAVLPTYRGQNEQGMALAAIGFAKAMRRRQFMAATSSVGPGAMNMVTAAAVAHANRLPLLLLSGDTFNSRIPDPVLQQAESFDQPSVTVNDAFRPVTRYWDRITHPAQVAQSLPLAIATLFDSADCGPAFIGLPQDVQAEAFDFPVRLFEPVVHELRRLRPDHRELAAAVKALRTAKAPLIVAGGGVHYALAEARLREFAEHHGVPVVETMAGKSTLEADHPQYAGPIGVSGSPSANELAARADVVLAVGTRLQDFTTGSWTVFGNEDLRIIGLNAARFDAAKHRGLPLVADAFEGLEALGSALSDWGGTPTAWREEGVKQAVAHHEHVRAAVASRPGAKEPSYAQVIGAVNAVAGPEDYAVSAAGGFPGELNVNWLSRGVATFDCEYGFSCMGYELAGAWGARMARSRGQVYSFAGDGSYLMLNSELLSSVISGHKIIVLLCDNGGFAVIERLQTGQGGASFNNMFSGIGPNQVDVDWVAHARSLGCEAERVETIDDLPAALDRARAAERTYVIAIRTAADAWTEGGAFWQVGVPEVSDRPSVDEARARQAEGRSGQRIGW
ncbi:MAG TPA: 3D-(3,5/4)-trihydroxycyclohexane-1,2-dione acylhydrolase (decyclizing) [Gaiellales bacterium]|jgi:3D-(3,5/4)-trihydroxycyclohexane-1,2-dione acylhydrolase (decyclizing)|nr:3D-(3,5/4)-trihydroxycyclohexane-1,2-dione acylhydrolase (decyclizing) [Gaiellales bacterium]